MKDRYVVKVFFVGLAEQINMGADWAFDTEAEARAVFNDIDVVSMRESFDEIDSKAIKKVRIVLMDSKLDKCLAEKQT